MVTNPLASSDNVNSGTGSGEEGEEGAQGQEERGAPLVLTIDDALELLGTGRYQHRLLIIAGLAFMAGEERSSSTLARMCPAPAPEPNP